MDLVKSVVMLPFSGGFNASHVTYDPDFWKELTNEQRRLLLDHTALAMAKTLIAYDQEVTDAIEAGTAQFIEPDESLNAAYSEWIENDFGGVAEIARNQLGIVEPEPVMAQFRTYLDKWTKLMNGVDRTKVDAEAVLKTNLFDKIDVATCGMQ